MQPPSTKPYMIRALYEWCADNGYTPYLVVAVDENTRVPMGYVKDGEIVLNINSTATHGLMIKNDAITFSARFNGVATDIYVPMEATRGIFARENGQGLFFEPETDIDADVEHAEDQKLQDDNPPHSPRGRPSLKVVK